jgi:heme/copper-type cytochrome/quinol oxidase subunit 2
MSSPSTINDELANVPDQAPATDTDATERANRRLTLTLFAAILALATIGVTISALANSMMGHRHGHAVSMGVSAASGATEQISLYVAPSWKRAPGGERHDAFSKTNFNVKVGQQVRLTVDNRDEAVHGITSAGAGVNIVVMPGVHTYTLVVHQAGRFKWICAYTCDPFSMGHTQYMQGYITAT